jgi:hypothetical protein
VVKISDLGLARLRSDIVALAGRPADDLTATGQLLGTVDFMAPEQATDMKSVDIRADIYSLGCTLYMLLTGRPPFHGPDFETSVSKLVAHASKPVPLPRTLRPEIPEELEAVVMQLLAKAPDDRVPAPARVAELLRPFVAGCDLPALARPCPGGDPAAIEPPHASTIDRHRTTFALGAEAALRRGQGESRATSATVPGRAGRRRVGAWIGLAVMVAVAAVLWKVYEPGRTGDGNKPQGKQPEDERPVTSTPPEQPGEKNPKDSGTVAAADGTTAELDDIVPRPDEWISALNRQPKVAFLTKESEDSVLHFNGRRHSLLASSNGMTLLELGHTEAPALAMQVMIDQPGWEGGIGVFFGLHDSEEAGPSIKRFQAVTIKTSRAKGIGSLMAHVAFFETDELGFPRRMHEAPVGEPVPIPVRPKLLDVLVRGQTVRVRLGNERDMETTLEPLRFVQPGDYQGKFGLFIRGASGTFENVRVKFPSGEGIP